MSNQRLPAERDNIIYNEKQSFSFNLLMNRRPQGVKSVIYVVLWVNVRSLGYLELLNVIKCHGDIVLG